MLDRLVRQHAAGRRDHSATLWSLLMLDAFLRRMQQPAAAAPIGLARRVVAAGAQP
jgi:asparagine synthase (glutamine-hydrolysing)